MLKRSIVLVLLLGNLFTDEPTDQKKKWWKKLKDVQKIEANPKPKKVQIENKKETVLQNKETKAVLTIPSFQYDEAILKNEKKFKQWGVRFDLSWLDPDIHDWSSYYEDNNVFNYGLEANYYLTENWSLNLGINFMETDGVGTLATTGNTGTTVKYTLIPYHIGGQYEVIFKRNKIFRPYLGAGYAYAQYKQKPKGSPNVKGHEDGYYLNAGVLINFYYWDKIKRQGDSYFENIYWVLEAERLWLKSNEANVDIGGLNYSVGIKFRF